MDITAKYDKASFLAFLQNNFLPDDFVPSEERSPIPDNKKISAATKLGACGSLDLSVYEFKHESNTDPRVTLSREAFAIMKNDLASNALAVFVNNDSPVWRLSLITSDVLLQDNNKTKRTFSNPRRYSYLLGERCKQHTPQSMLFDKKKGINGRIKDNADLLSRFAVDVLNKEFYAHLIEWYDKSLDDITIDLSNASKILGKKIDDELKPQAVIRVIIRLLFIWFMKEKGLIPKDFFTQDFKNEFIKQENTYYNAVLQNLFFAVLNKKINERRFRKQDTSNRYDPEKNDYGICDVFRFKDFFRDGKADTFLELTRKIPFVNGGLFTCHDYKFSGKDTATNKRNVEQNYIIDGFSDNPKDRAKISDSVIFKLIELFNNYAFTIEENTPQDIDLALDPELLGTVFENLIGTYNPETKESARKATGSFYTPREIVDYMCKESLKEALASKLPDLREQIADLIESAEDRLDFPQKNTVVAAITSLKILDPACGSGAFPMGMFTLMVKTVEKLQERKTTYKNKLDIITNCIYGVDIQNIAIEISKLRFFISLLVDYDVPAKIEDFEVLPNLETKFAAANTLIGLDLQRLGDIFTNQTLLPKCKELANIFLPFTTAKTPEEKKDIKNAFEAKKQELVVELENIMKGNQTKDDVIEKIKSWNPFNVCCTSPFFDSGIMFGVCGGFDVVIGNPPYVQIKQIPWDDRRNFEKFYKSATGRFNLFYLFLERSAELSKKNGLSVYIVPDRLMLNTQCGNLRDFLLNIQTLIELDSFDESVFESAVVDSVIVMYKNMETIYKTVKAKNKSNIHTIGTDKYKTIPIEHFTTSPSNQFDLAYDADVEIIINRIRRNAVLLGDIADVKDGIIQGKIPDKLFLKKPINSDSKKLLFGENVTRYHIKYDNNWVNYKTVEMMKIEVKRRGEGVRHGLWMRTPEIFERNKILTRQTADKIIACFDTDNYYYANTLHGTTITDLNYLPKYVLAILNSKLITWYYRTITAEEGKVFAQIKIELLKLLPIHTLEKEQQKLFVAFVDQILNQLAADPQVDTRGLEAQVDKAVYKLYGLTDDEIKVVEGKG